jgi:hypothetical protein
MPPLSTISLFCSVLLTFILKFYCFQSIFYMKLPIFFYFCYILALLKSSSFLFDNLCPNSCQRWPPSIGLFFSCIDYVSLYLYDLLNNMIKNNSFINISDNSFELYWYICNLWKKSWMILKPTLNICLWNRLSILHKKQEYQKRLQQNCWQSNYTEPGMFTVCIHMTW